MDLPAAVQEGIRMARRVVVVMEQGDPRNPQDARVGVAFYGCDDTQAVGLMEKAKHGLLAAKARGARQVLDVRENGDAA